MTEQGDFGRAIANEGIITNNDLPHGVLKGDRLLNTSSFLFKFILGDTDPRWNIVASYLQAQNESKFKPIHFENSLLAIYLSETPSYRNRYSSYVSEENIRHLCRGICNLAAYPELAVLFNEGQQELPSPLQITFSRTNKINAGKTKENITGCPEALYQLRLFSEHEYIGRIGFNIHLEESNTAVSITNVQGIPNSEELYGQFEEQFGVGVFNLLIRRLKLMFSNEQENINVRGLRNPKNIESSPLYNALFKAEKISRFSFHR